MAAPVLFSNAKKTRLKSQDFSKKGSIDEEIVALVNYINDTDYFCTTSSCAGRIIVICEGSNNVIKKRGCQWLFVSHEKVDLASLETSLKDLQGNAVFKFEPFILHVHCRSLEDAKLMNVVAIESGFKNSGITVGKGGKVMVAVRSTHGLEVPLSNGTELLVSSEYLAFLVQQANSKLQENSKRIARFHANLSKRLETYTPRTVSSADANSCKHCGRRQPKGQSLSAHTTSDMGTSGVLADKTDAMQSGYRHLENTREDNRSKDLKDSGFDVQIQDEDPTISLLFDAGQEVT